jgi:hypothetical protein
VGRGWDIYVIPFEFRQYFFQRQLIRVDGRGLPTSRLEVGAASGGRFPFYVRKAGELCAAAIERGQPEACEISIAVRYCRILRLASPRRPVAQPGGAGLPANQAGGR